MARRPEINLFSRRFILVSAIDVELACLPNDFAPLYFLFPKRIEGNPVSIMFLPVPDTTFVPMSSTKHFNKYVFLQPDEGFNGGMGM